MAAVGAYPDTPASRSFRARDGTVMTYNPESRTLTLPDLRSSDQGVDKSKPLPTSLQSDFLPEDILMAITHPPAQFDKLGPANRYRNLDTSANQVRKKPAGVWTHPKRRERFKHLTENTPCVCGAGKDISFLYDVPKKEEKRNKADEFDPTEVRKDEEDQDKPKKKVIRLPDTLIPEEYHVVKNRGVLGLEYYEDDFATQPNDHDAHLVVFPSMCPASRYEVVQLKNTMEAMLEKAGLSEGDFDLSGPTQMHNLLELIKKEQNIYNIVFHELIRQVSVECLERGELLANIRSRYGNLVNKIPKQIKGLHEEVLAQRALDRRLTEELMRFKSTIAMLTDELSEVKEHDREVTTQATQAQEDLKSALAESQKNASLLAEYHDLYELQRQRLEKQVNGLSEEKEIWSTAAYSLALKVTEEHALTTAKRLHVSEKSWAKLANHFTIMLSDKDTELLTQLQGYVDKWRDLVAEYNTGMKHREEYMRERVSSVKTGILQWVTYFQKYVFDKRKDPSAEGHFVRAPDEKRILALYNDIKEWESVLSDENEKYGGDLLLAGQELLKEIAIQVSSWTDCAINIFNRHRGEGGESHPDHSDMVKVNQEVETLLRQFSVRLTGENGTAIGIISAGNSMEVWDTKFTALVHGNNPLPEQDWLRLYTNMDDWLTNLDMTLENIGSTQKEDEKAKGLQHYNVDVLDSMRLGQKWLSSTTNSIDSEDAKLVEAVSSMHTEMVKWMVQMLLRLAPDREEHSKEAKEAVLLGSTSVAELQSNAKSLFQRLFNFSTYVTSCCSGIVNEEVQRKIAEQDDNAEYELRELQRLQTECDQWIITAKILLEELSRVTEQQALEAAAAKKTEKGEDELAYHDKEKLEPQERPPPMGAPTADQPPALQATAPTATAPVQPKVPGEKIEIIGTDSNTHGKSIAEVQKEAGEMSGQPRTPVTRGPEVPDTKKAFEALAAVGSLQDQLVQTEERAQRSETRVTEVETDLKDANEKIRALEKQITQLVNEAKPKSTAESTKTSLLDAASGISRSDQSPSDSADKSAKEGEKKDKKGPPSRASSRGSSKSRKK